MQFYKIALFTLLLLSVEGQTSGQKYVLSEGDPFTDDFTGWGVATSHCGSYGTLVGGYGVMAGGSFSKTYILPSAGCEVRVQMKYVQIDTWDGERAAVKIGDYTWEDTLKCCGNTGNKCGRIEGDAHHDIDVTQTISGAELTIEALSQLDQHAGDESFGITDIVITVNSCPVTTSLPQVLYKSVLGTDNPTYDDCVNIPASTPYLKLVMGTFVDYFRPVVGKTCCDMLKSWNAHQWSSDGQNWVTPPFYITHLGGSALNYPSDGRACLSFWGGHGNNGGCCQDSDNGIQSWGKSFELYYPGEGQATGQDIDTIPDLKFYLKVDDYTSGNAWVDRVSNVEVHVPGSAIFHEGYVHLSGNAITAPLQTNPNYMQSATYVIRLRVPTLTNNLGWVMSQFDDYGWSRALTISDYRVGNVGQTPGYFDSGLGSFPTDSWQVLVGTWTQGGACQTFLQGTPGNSRICSNGRGTDSNEKLIIGGKMETDGDHNPQSVDISDVLVFNRVLSTDEINFITSTLSQPKRPVLKDCRWESNHDQNPNSADYMGWTCANDEILTGFGLSADQHDVTKVQCCKVGGHSSIKPNTCTYVESNHERAKCGNGNDHMVFSGAYDKRAAANDAVTEILAGKCCEVECDAAWCAGKDWGVDKNNCQVISTAGNSAQELVCPTGTLMTEIEDGLAGNAHGVQKVASVTCCAFDVIAPPTQAPSPAPTTARPTSAPTSAPTTARPTSAPTRAPSTSMPSIAPTTVDDCLLALKDSSQRTDSQYLSSIDQCLPGCRSNPRRALESRLLSENNRRQ